MEVRRSEAKQKRLQISILKLPLPSEKWPARGDSLEPENDIKTRTFFSRLLSFLIRANQRFFFVSDCLGRHFLWKKNVSSREMVLLLSTHHPTAALLARLRWQTTPQVTCRVTNTSWTNDARCWLGARWNTLEIEFHYLQVSAWQAFDETSNLISPSMRHL